MPDLAAHALISFTGFRIYEIFYRKTSYPSTTLYMVVLGSVLPDILDKTIPYALVYLCWDRWEIPVSLSFLHTPSMLVLVIYMLSILFAEPFRKRAFLSLSVGVSSHLFLDFLQGNICKIGYMWFFPFSSSRPMVVNVLYDDSTVSLIPILAVLSLCIEVVFHMIRKRPLLPSSAREP